LFLLFFKIYSVRDNTNLFLADISIANENTKSAAIEIDVFGNISYNLCAFFSMLRIKWSKHIVYFNMLKIILYPLFNIFIKIKPFQK